MLGGLSYKAAALADAHLECTEYLFAKPPAVCATRSRFAFDDEDKKRFLQLRPQGEDLRQKHVDKLTTQLLLPSSTSEMLRLASGGTTTDRSRQRSTRSDREVVLLPYNRREQDHRVEFQKGTASSTSTGTRTSIQNSSAQVPDATFFRCWEKAAARSRNIEMNALKQLLLGGEALRPARPVARTKMSYTDSYLSSLLESQLLTTRETWKRQVEFAIEQIENHGPGSLDSSATTPIPFDVRPLYCKRQARSRILYIRVRNRMRRLRKRAEKKDRDKRRRRPRRRRKKKKRAFGGKMNNNPMFGKKGRKKLSETRFRADHKGRIYKMTKTMKGKGRGKRAHFTRERMAGKIKKDKKTGRPKALIRNGQMCRLDKRGKVVVSRKTGKPVSRPIQARKIKWNKPRPMVHPWRRCKKAGRRRGWYRKRPIWRRQADWWWKMDKTRRHEWKLNNAFGVRCWKTPVKKVWRRALLPRGAGPKGYPSYFRKSWKWKMRRRTGMWKRKCFYKISAHKISRKNKKRSFKQKHNCYLSRVILLRPRYFQGKNMKRWRRWRSRKVKWRFRKLNRKRKTWRRAHRWYQIRKKAYRKLRHNRKKTVLCYFDVDAYGNIVGRKENGLTGDLAKNYRLVREVKRVQDKGKTGAWTCFHCQFRNGARRITCRRCNAPPHQLVQQPGRNNVSSCATFAPTSCRPLLGTARPSWDDAQDFYRLAFTGQAVAPSENLTDWNLDLLLHVATRNCAELNQRVVVQERVGNTAGTGPKMTDSTLRKKQTPEDDLHSEAGDHDTKIIINRAKMQLLSRRKKEARKYNEWYDNLYEQQVLKRKSRTRKTLLVRDDATGELFCVPDYRKVHKKHRLESYKQMRRHLPPVFFPLMELSAKTDQYLAEVEQNLKNKFGLYDREFCPRGALSVAEMLEDDDVILSQTGVTRHVKRRRDSAIPWDRAQASVGMLMQAELTTTLDYYERRTRYDEMQLVVPRGGRQELQGKDSRSPEKHLHNEDARFSAERLGEEILTPIRKVVGPHLYEGWKNAILLRLKQGQQQYEAGSRLLRENSKPPLVPKHWAACGLQLAPCFVQMQQQQQQVVGTTGSESASTSPSPTRPSIDGTAALSKPTPPSAAILPQDISRGPAVPVVQWRKAQPLAQKVRALANGEAVLYREVHIQDQHLDQHFLGPTFNGASTSGCSSSPEDALANDRQNARDPTAQNVQELPADEQMSAQGQPPGTSRFSSTSRHSSSKQTSDVVDLDEEDDLQPAALDEAAREHHNDCGSIASDAPSDRVSLVLTTDDEEEEDHDVAEEVQLYSAVKTAGMRELQWEEDRLLAEDIDQQQEKLAQEFQDQQFASSPARTLSTCPSPSQERTSEASSMSPPPVVPPQRAFRFATPLYKKFNSQRSAPHHLHRLDYYDKILRASYEQNYQFDDQGDPVPTFAPRDVGEGGESDSESSLSSLSSFNSDDFMSWKSSDSDSVSSPSVSSVSDSDDEGGQRKANAKNLRTASDGDASSISDSDENDSNDSNDLEDVLSRSRSSDTVSEIAEEDKIQQHFLDWAKVENPEAFCFHHDGVMPHRSYEQELKEEKRQDRLFEREEAKREAKRVKEEAKERRREEKMEAKRKERKEQKRQERKKQEESVEGRRNQRNLRKAWWQSAVEEKWEESRKRQKQEIAEVGLKAVVEKGLCTLGLSKVKEFLTMQQQWNEFLLQPKTDKFFAQLGCKTPEVELQFHPGSSTTSQQPCLLTTGKHAHEEPLFEYEHFQRWLRMKEEKQDIVDQVALLVQRVRSKLGSDRAKMPSRLFELALQEFQRQRILRQGKYMSAPSASLVFPAGDRSLMSSSCRGFDYREGLYNRGQTTRRADHLLIDDVETWSARINQDCDVKIALPVPAQKHRMRAMEQLELARRARQFREADMYSTKGFEFSPAGIESLANFLMPFHRGEEHFEWMKRKKLQEFSGPENYLQNGAHKTFSFQSPGDKPDNSMLVPPPPGKRFSTNEFEGINAPYMMGPLAPACFGHFAIPISNKPGSEPDPRSQEIMPSLLRASVHKQRFVPWDPDQLEIQMAIQTAAEQDYFYTLARDRAKWFADRERRKAQQLRIKRYENYNDNDEDNDCSSAASDNYDVASDPEAEYDALGKADLFRDILRVTGPLNQANIEPKSQRLWKEFAKKLPAFFAQRRKEKKTSKTRRKVNRWWRKHQRKKNFGKISSTMKSKYNAGVVPNRNDSKPFVKEIPVEMEKEEQALCHADNGNNDHPVGNYLPENSLAQEHVPQQALDNVFAISTSETVGTTTATELHLQLSTAPSDGTRCASSRTPATSEPLQFHIGTPEKTRTAEEVAQDHGPPPAQHFALFTPEELNQPLVIGAMDEDGLDSCWNNQTWSSATSSYSDSVYNPAASTAFVHGAGGDHPASSVVSGAGGSVGQYSAFFGSDSRPVSPRQRFATEGSVVFAESLDSSPICQPGQRFFDPEVYSGVEQAVLHCDPPRPRGQEEDQDAHQPRGPSRRARANTRGSLLSSRPPASPLSVTPAPSYDPSTVDLHGTFSIRGEGGDFDSLAASQQTVPLYDGACTTSTTTRVNKSGVFRNEELLVDTKHDGREEEVGDNVVAENSASGSSSSSAVDHRLPANFSFQSDASSASVSEEDDEDLPLVGHQKETLLPREDDDSSSSSSSSSSDDDNESSLDGTTKKKKKVKSTLNPDAQEFTPGKKTHGGPSTLQQWMRVSPPQNDSIATPRLDVASPPLLGEAGSSPFTPVSEAQAVAWERRGEGRGQNSTSDVDEDSLLSDSEQEEVLSAQKKDAAADEDSSDSLSSFEKECEMEEQARREKYACNDGVSLVEHEAQTTGGTGTSAPCNEDLVWCAADEDIYGEQLLLPDEEDNESCSRLSPMHSPRPRHLLELTDFEYVDGRKTTDEYRLFLEGCRDYVHPNSFEENLDRFQNLDRINLMKELLEKDRPTSWIRRKAEKDGPLSVLLDLRDAAVEAGRYKNEEEGEAEAGVEAGAEETSIVVRDYFYVEPAAQAPIPGWNEFVPGNFWHVCYMSPSTMPPTHFFATNEAVDYAWDNRQLWEKTVQLEQKRYQLAQDARSRIMYGAVEAKRIKDELSEVVVDTCAAEQIQKAEDAKEWELREQKARQKAEEKRRRQQEAENQRLIDKFGGKVIRWSEKTKSGDWEVYYEIVPDKDRINAHKRDQKEIAGNIDAFYDAQQAQVSARNKQEEAQLDHAPLGQEARPSQATGRKRAILDLAGTDDDDDDNESEDNWFHTAGSKTGKSTAQRKIPPRQKMKRTPPEEIIPWRRLLDPPPHVQKFLDYTRQRAKDKSEGKRRRSSVSTFEDDDSGPDAAQLLDEGQTLILQRLKAENKQKKQLEKAKKRGRVSRWNRMDPDENIDCFDGDIATEPVTLARDFEEEEFAAWQQEFGGPAVVPSDAHTSSALENDDDDGGKNFFGSDDTSDTESDETDSSFSSGDSDFELEEEVETDGVLFSAVPTAPAPRRSTSALVVAPSGSRDINHCHDDVDPLRMTTLRVRVQESDTSFRFLRREASMGVNEQRILKKVTQPSRWADVHFGGFDKAENLLDPTQHPFFQREQQLSLVQESYQPEPFLFPRSKKDAWKLQWKTAEWFHFKKRNRTSKAKFGKKWRKVFLKKQKRGLWPNNLDRMQDYQMEKIAYVCPDGLTHYPAVKAGLVQDHPILALQAHKAELVPYDRPQNVMIKKLKPVFETQVKEKKREFLLREDIQRLIDYKGRPLERSPPMIRRRLREVDEELQCVQEEYINAKREAEQAEEDEERAADEIEFGLEDLIQMVGEDSFHVQELREKQREQLREEFRQEKKRRSKSERQRYREEQERLEREKQKLREKNQFKREQDKKVREAERRRLEEDFERLHADRQSLRQLWVDEKERRRKKGLKIFDSDDGKDTSESSSDEEENASHDMVNLRKLLQLGNNKERSSRGERRRRETRSARGNKTKNSSTSSSSSSSLAKENDEARSRASQKLEVGYLSSSDSSDNDSVSTENDDFDEQRILLTTKPARTTPAASGSSSGGGTSRTTRTTLRTRVPRFIDQRTNFAKDVVQMEQRRDKILELKQRQAAVRRERERSFLGRKHKAAQQNQNYSSSSGEKLQITTSAGAPNKPVVVLPPLGSYQARDAQLLVKVFAEQFDFFSTRTSSSCSWSQASGGTNLTARSGATAEVELLQNLVQTTWQEIQLEYKSVTLEERKREETTAMANEENQKQLVKAEVRRTKDVIRQREKLRYLQRRERKLQNKRKRVDSEMAEMEMKRLLQHRAMALAKLKDLEQIGVGPPNSATSEEINQKTSNDDPVPPGPGQDEEDDSSSLPSSRASSSSEDWSGPPSTESEAEDGEDVDGGVPPSSPDVEDHTVTVDLSAAPSCPRSPPSSTPPSDDGSSDLPSDKSSSSSSDRVGDDISESSASDSETDGGPAANEDNNKSLMRRTSCEKKCDEEPLQGEYTDQHSTEKDEKSSLQRPPSPPPRELILTLNPEWLPFFVELQDCGLLSLANFPGVSEIRVAEPGDYMMKNKRATTSSGRTTDMLSADSQMDEFEDLDPEKAHEMFQISKRLAERSLFFRREEFRQKRRTTTERKSTSEVGVDKKSSGIMKSHSQMNIVKPPAPAEEGSPSNPSSAGAPKILEPRVRTTVEEDVLPTQAQPWRMTKAQDRARARTRARENEQELRDFKYKTTHAIYEDAARRVGSLVDSGHCSVTEACWHYGYIEICNFFHRAAKDLYCVVSSTSSSSSGVGDRNFRKNPKYPYLNYVEGQLPWGGLLERGLKRDARLLAHFVSSPGGRAGNTNAGSMSSRRLQLEATALLCGLRGDAAEQQFFSCWQEHDRERHKESSARTTRKARRIAAEELREEIESAREDFLCEVLQEVRTEKLWDDVDREPMPDQQPPRPVGVNKTTDHHAGVLVRKSSTMIADPRRMLERAGQRILQRETLFALGEELLFPRDENQTGNPLSTMMNSAVQPDFGLFSSSSTRNSALHDDVVDPPSLTDIIDLEFCWTLARYFFRQYALCEEGGRRTWSFRGFSSTSSAPPQYHWILRTAHWSPEERLQLFQARVKEQLEDHSVRTLKEISRT
ncbi:unnamed protein product [Amoebophrya sp. A120]|nr:unnamed protein product [Amoebophrya sp. A120]|eukprot:GSA120T00024210001.1